MYYMSKVYKNKNSGLWLSLTENINESEIREIVEKASPDELCIAYQNTRRALMWIDFINNGRKIMRLPYGAGSDR